MHFASKKVYAKSKAPRRDLDQPFAAAPAFNAFAPAPAPIPPIPQANTNVVSIDLGELASKVDLLAGDAAPCQDCGAIFNSLSKTSLGRGGETQWTCEFCGNSNPLELEEEERPKSDTCDFILSPAIESKVSDDAPTLLFVVDVSGSMCVTTELQGSIKLRGNNTQALASLNSGNINDQYLPGQRRDITYVSRLQCVQAAIENQLETLHKQHPKAKVGLVCFNNEVTIIGDGTSNPIVVTGDKLFDYENLLQSGAQHSIKASLENSKDSLIHKVYKLEESGSTALGPAVTVAVGMCMNTPGSKIVLATDGIANTGVGSLDSQDNSATDFYSKLAHFAKEKAITISVIGIRGDNVGMNAIGKLADITTGDIDIVDPVNITKNFTSILEAKLVATNVEVKLFLHKGFKFPADDNWTTKGLYASRSVGNAFSDSEITAQFEQKEELELSKVLESEQKDDAKKEDDPTVLPFQVQITYTSLNGMKCLRVITKTKELTRDFAEVEKDLDVAVLGMHANDVVAQQAQQGNFFEAMNQQMAYGQLLDRNVRTDSEKAAFGNWSVGQQNVFAHQPGYSPQQFAYQQQPQASMNPYAAPPPPQSSAFSNFTFGSAQPANPSPFGQPQQQQESSAFDSFKGFVNSFMQPTQPSPVANNPMFQQQQQQDLDDDTSNAVYQQRNCRKNKQQWGGERKY